MVDPLIYFSFQPVLHDWCNKGRGMSYPICGMVHIIKTLLLMEKGNPSCGGRWFPYENVLSASLNKIFPSFHHKVMLNIQLFFMIQFVILLGIWYV